MNKQTGKKVISAALASSLVLGSLAGLPLSTKGVFEHLGAGTAYAADSAAVTTIKAKLDAVRAVMTEPEKQAIRTARDAVVAKDISGTVDVIWNKVIAEYPAASTNTALKEKIGDFIKDLATYYDNSAIDRIKANYSDLFYQLADYTELPRPSVEDGVIFAQELEAKVDKVIQNAGSDWAGYLMGHTPEIKAELKKAFDGSKTKTADILREYNIGADDLVNAVVTLNLEVGASLFAAEKAFVDAYARYLYDTPTTPPGSVYIPVSEVTGPNLPAAKEAITKVTASIAEATKGLTANKALQEALQLVQECLR